MANEEISFTTVTRHNVQELQLVIKHALQKADFIAVDCEFTGLGVNQPATRDACVFFFIKILIF
jgi:hypothetical protein